MYGTLSCCALTIFFCIRSSLVSISTRTPAARNFVGHRLEVRHVPLGDRDAGHLHRSQPGREGAGVVLDQNAEEPLDRPEQRPVDHDRLLPGAVGGLVFQAEALGQLEIDLDRGHLPGAADRVLGLHADLRARRTRRRPGRAPIPGRILGRDLATPRWPAPTPRPSRGTSGSFGSTAPGRSPRARSPAADPARSPADSRAPRAICSRLQKMCESSMVRPRTRVSPCTTPDRS